MYFTAHTVSSGQTSAAVARAVFAIASQRQRLPGLLYAWFDAPYSANCMRCTALMLCRDHRSLEVVSLALDQSGIEADASASAPDAVERLARSHYSALVVDFDAPGAAHVVRMARMTSPHRRPVVFAMISEKTPVAAAFHSGANFVLYKPLVEEQVMRSLRAGKCFMKPERRRSHRERIESVAHLQFGIAPLPVVVLDVSEIGISVQTTEPLPPVPEVPFHFVLPGTEMAIRGTGEILWADEFGRAGLTFKKLSATSARHLQNWLGKRAKRKAPRAVMPRSVRTLRAVKQMANHS